MLFPSIETVGTLFDLNLICDEAFSGKGNCSGCSRETVSRSSGLHLLEHTVGSDPFQDRIELIQGRNQRLILSRGAERFFTRNGPRRSMRLAATRASRLLNTV